MSVIYHERNMNVFSVKNLIEKFADVICMKL